RRSAARQASARRARTLPRDHIARPACSGACLTRNGIRSGGGWRFALRLLEWRILDVVLVGVVLGELVHHVGALAVRVVDLDERLPFVGPRVLRNDRLDGA